MAIIHFSAASHAAQALVRECPNCHLKQQTKPSQRTKAVSCSRCGTEIPPRRK
jgi:hypothetical protein